MRRRLIPVALLALGAVPVHAAEPERCRFGGHKGVVYSAEFSADGRRVLTCGADETARLWDAATGKELVAFRHSPAKPGPFKDARFALTRLSPDGRRVLTVTANNYCHDADAWPAYRSYGSGADLRANDAARLWDAATGKVVAEWVIDHPQKQVEGVNPFGATFSPDGTLVLTTFGSDLDRTARVHEADTGKERFRLEGHKHPVVGVAFSADGKRIATASLDQTARVWDATTGKCLKTFEGHTSGVTGVAFSPDGSRLLTTCAGYTHQFELRANGTSGGSSTVHDVVGRVWDVGTGKEVVALAWGPLPGTPARREFNLGPLSIRFETTGIEDKLGFVRTAAFGPDGMTILTAGVVGCSSGWGDERHPTTWDVSTGRPRVRFKGEKFQDVLTAAVSPDGKLVAAAGKEGAVRVWDATTGKEAGSLRGHTQRVRSVAFSPDGTRLVTASDDGTSRVWTAPGKR